MLIGIVPELMFLAADPAGAGMDMGTAAGLAGVGVTMLSEASTVSPIPSSSGTG